MLRHRNLFAFSTTWLLFSIMFAYAFARYVFPDHTDVPSGIFGLSAEEIPVFDWEVFLYCFCGCFLVSPLLHLYRRAFVLAAVEFVLLLTTGWLVIYFSTWSFSGIEDTSGFLGFNPLRKSSYKTESLLVLLSAIYAIYSIVRFIFEKKARVKVFWDRPGAGLVLLVAGWTAVVCYFIGIHVPVFHSVKFWFFEDEVSLSQSIDAFFKSGEVFIGVMVLTFTLIFPVIKFMYMFWMLLAEPGRWALRVNTALSYLGKYSMLDVFVLALLLLNLKFDSEILDMQLRSGVAWFAASIILNMAVASLLTFRHARRAAKRSLPDG